MLIRSKHVKMLDTLYDKLVKEAKVDDKIDPDELDEDGYYVNDDYPWATNEVYMLGQNKHGIITRAIRVSDDSCGGCEFMPRIETEDLTDAYLTLANARLVAIGYAITIRSAQRDDLPTWEADGQKFLEVPNFLIVDFCPIPSAVRWNAKADAIQNVIIHKTKTAK